jgi:Mrp family chromosome partitioning ATPase/capsular polysaccharide biosynthesis protein
LLRDETPSESTLRDYLDTIRRWKWLILTGVVVVPAVAVLMASRESPLYQASAQVWIKRQNLAFQLQNLTDPTAFDANRTLNTEAQLARIPTVARRALNAARVQGYPSDLLGASSVTTAQDSDLLTFAVRDRRPERAILLANAYARAFTRYEQEIDNASIRNALASIEKRIADLEATGAKDSPLYTSLLTTEGQLRGVQALQSPRAIVVREAGGAGQIAPHEFRVGILGAILGIVLGFGLAFLADALDTRIRSEAQVRSRLGLPLLGRLPKPPSKIRKRNGVVMLEQPLGAEAEAFRMLATNLEFVTLESSLKTILAASALPQEGKTTTVANLGVALARQGRKVTLLDLDLHSPSLHALFDLDQQPGLTDVVLGQAQLEAALVSIDLGAVMKSPPPSYSGTMTLPPGEQANGNRIRQEGSLDVLPAGLPPPNAAEFVAFTPVSNLLARIRAESEIVLIDSSPLLLSAGAVALAGQVDAVLVISRLKILRTRALAELARVLEASHTRMLGFVLTGSDIEKGYGYGGAYHLTAVPRPQVDEMFDAGITKNRQG